MASIHLLKSVLGGLLGVVALSSSSYSSLHSSSRFFALAADDAPCMDHWSGPSKDNDFACNEDDLIKWITGSTGLYLALVPLVIGCIAFIPCCCCILISRYACKCCGSAELRPGYICCGGNELDMRSESDLIRMYSSAGVVATKGAAIICSILGIVGFILCLVGGIKFSQGVEDVPAAVFSLADWALGLIDQVMRGVKDPTTGDYPTGFDLGQFESIMNDITRVKDDVMRQGVDPYKSLINTLASVPAYVSCLPMLVLLLPSIAAICSFRVGLPLCVIITAFPLQWIYLTLGSIFMLLLWPINVLCDDIHAPTGAKSVTQWLLMPACDDHAPFADIQQNVEQMEKDAAVEGCNALLRVCSPSTIYSASREHVVFVCAGLTDPQTQCSTLEHVRGFGSSLTLKSGAPETCGGNSQCPIDVCADKCVVTGVRSAATDAVSALDTALRIRNTYTQVLLPWMSCEALFEKVRSSGPEQACEMLQGGLGSIKDGVLFIGFTLLAVIMVCLLGQKRFINQNAHKLFADTDSRDYSNPNGGVMMSAINVPMQQMHVISSSSSSPATGISGNHNTVSYVPMHNASGGGNAAVVNVMNTGYARSANAMPSPTDVYIAPPPVPLHQKSIGSSFDNDPALSEGLLQNAESSTLIDDVDETPPVKKTKKVAKKTAAPTPPPATASNGIDDDDLGDGPSPDEI